MRAIRIASLGLVAAAAMAVFAVSATAAPPEWGQCVPASGKTGEYTRGGCGKTAPLHNGTFNWQPEPTANPKFSAVGEEVALQTVGGKKVTCAAATMGGEFTGPKTATTSLTLIGCTNQGKECQTNPLKPGEIGTGAIEQEGKETKFPEYEAELGYIVAPPSTPVVGLDLKAKSPATSFFTFTCGKLPEAPGLQGTITGSVIGRLKPLQQMTNEWKLLFVQSGGKQQYTHFAEGPEDTLTGEYHEGESAGTTEATGYKTKFSFEPEEFAEIKAK